MWCELCDLKCHRIQNFAFIVVNNKIKSYFSKYIDYILVYYKGHRCLEHLKQNEECIDLNIILLLNHNTKFRKKIQTSVTF